MTRYTITVPTAPSDGAHIAEIETHILRLAGGFTMTPGYGAWLNGSGQVVRDPVFVYTVDSADPELAAALNVLAAYVAATLDQDAVYLTASPVVTQLVVGLPATGEEREEIPA
jgi:hypothetical protein